jgi:hypothetical protein
MLETSRRIDPTTSPCVGLAAVTALVLAGFPFLDASAFTSQASIAAAVIPSQSAGGPGVASVRLADTGTFTQPGLFSQFASVDVSSAVATGAGAGAFFGWECAAP